MAIWNEEIEDLLINIIHIQNGKQALLFKWFVYPHSWSLFPFLNDKCHLLV